MKLFCCCFLCGGRCDRERVPTPCGEPVGSDARDYQHTLQPHHQPVHLGGIESTSVSAFFFLQFCHLPLLRMVHKAVRCTHARGFTPFRCAWHCFLLRRIQGTKYAISVAVLDQAGKKLSSSTERIIETVRFVLLLLLACMLHL